MINEAFATIQNNFNLKHVLVDLIYTSRFVKHTSMSLGELEAIRTQRNFITASKYGLEKICGASCETGAQ